MRFDCAYCPESFPHLRGLIKHFREKHTGEAKSINVPPVFRLNTKPKREALSHIVVNTKGYYLDDPGCEAATEYLGRQSSCLKCPFRHCVLDDVRGFISQKKKNRDHHVRQLVKDGMKLKDAAEKFGLSLRSIQRIVHE